MSDKNIIHLNDLPEFQWASAGNNEHMLGKVCIGHESFWLRDCQEGDNGVWVGYVDNQPYGCELNLGDRVSFVISIQKTDMRKVVIKADWAHNATVFTGLCKTFKFRDLF